MEVNRRLIRDATSVGSQIHNICNLQALPARSRSCPPRTMALQQLPLRLRSLSSAIRHRAMPHLRLPTHRPASTVSETPALSSAGAAPPPPLPSSSPPTDPPSSSHDAPFPTASQIAAYDPVARARARKAQLPPSRYLFPPFPHPPTKPSLPATASAPPASTAVPSTRTAPRQPPPQTRASSTQAPSPSRASRKPTPPPYARTS